MATLLIILDGAADRIESELNNSTPLGLANTPNLDFFATNGSTGLLKILPDKMVPQTHTGVLSLLGYDVIKSEITRGPLEALGHYKIVPVGSLCARGNFSSLVNGKIPNRRVNRNLSQDEADELVRFLNKKIKISTGEMITLKSISTYRLSLLIIPDKNKLSGRISNTDPGYATNADFSVPQNNVEFDPIKSFALNNQATSKHTAKIVNEFIEKSYSILSTHPINIERQAKNLLPANYILIRDFGISLPNLPTLKEKYNLSGAYFYELPIELGISKLLGLTPFKINIDSNLVLSYNSLAKMICNAMKKFDFIICHVKGPDEPGHDGDWKLKKQVIEKIDKGLLKYFRKNIDINENIIIVTSDHATPWSLGTHSSDKVPILVCGKNIPKDKTLKFSEEDCSKGKLPIRKAIDLIPKIFI